MNVSGAFDVNLFIKAKKALKKKYVKKEGKKMSNMRIL